MDNKLKKERGNLNLMIDRLSSYKWIKFSQSLVLIVMGILYIALSRVPEFVNFITMAFAITLLVYSVLEIFSAIMIKKSVLSSEIFVSLIIFAISLMIICKSDLRSDPQLLVWFFGILMVGYTAILITSGVLSLTVYSDDEKYGTTKGKRITIAVLQFIASGILIALDVCLWIFGLKQNEDNNIILVPLLIGIALILMGLASMFYGFQAIKTENILKKQKEQNEEMALEAVERSNNAAANKEATTPAPKEETEKEKSAIIVDATESKLEEPKEIKQIESSDSNKKKK